MFFDILREAVEDPNDFNKEGKIQALEDAFGHDPVALKISYMISTSHEYAKPNVAAALSFVKNYDWEETHAKLDDIQGIDKPVNQDKVKEIGDTIKAEGNSFPLIVVDKFHGVTPQTPGKHLLFDGHHRKHALVDTGHESTPVYKGTYTGDAEKSQDELATLESVFESKGVSGYDYITEASKKKDPIEKVDLTPAERDAVKAKYGEVGCSFFKNAKNDKYFCTTHRARSKFYDSPTDIPMDTVKFISSTS